MNNTDYRYHVISDDGLEPDLCSSTKEGAFASAEKLSDTSGPMLVFDSMAHQDRPQTWKLGADGTWRIAGLSCDVVTC